MRLLLLTREWTVIRIFPWPSVDRRSLIKQVLSSNSTEKILGISGIIWLKQIIGEKREIKELGLLGQEPTMKLRRVNDLRLQNKEWLLPVPEEIRMPWKKKFRIELSRVQAELTGLERIRQVALWAINSNSMWKRFRGKSRKKRKRKE